ncbi:MAG: hypothetical protein R2911_25445 [Caldilineaceae bacterium]
MGIVGLFLHTVDGQPVDALPSGQRRQPGKPAGYKNVLRAGKEREEVSRWRWLRIRRSEYAA